MADYKITLETGDPSFKGSAGVYFWKGDRYHLGYRITSKPDGTFVATIPSGALVQLVAKRSWPSETYAPVEFTEAAVKQLGEPLPRPDGYNETELAATQQPAAPSDPGSGSALPVKLALPDAGVQDGITLVDNTVRYGFDSGTVGSWALYQNERFTQANPAATGQYTRFKNCVFTGHMNITGNDIIFEHCRFEKGLGVSGAERWQVLDCEFVTTADKVDDGMHISGDSGLCGEAVVARSHFYVDGTLPAGQGIHWDCVQIRGAKWIDFVECLFEAPSVHTDALNGALYMENANGGNQGIRLLGCHMEGAWAYTTAFQGPDCAMLGCVIVDPHYGPHYSRGANAVPSGGLARYQQADTILVEDGAASRCPLPYLGQAAPVA